jgi:hypothetical protein
MPQQELLKKAIQVLNQAGIQYMITGSVVSSLQGETRSAHDIDMVIAIQKSVAKRLVKAFLPPDFYLDEDNILDAIKRQSIFNLIKKQFTDALRVYEVQYGKLDIDYLEQWVKKLNLESLWKRLMDEAETV